MKKYISLFVLLMSLILSVSAKSDKKDEPVKKWYKQSYCVEGYTEEEARLLHNSREIDPIEGIWQNYNGERWSIERFTDQNIPEQFKYRIVKVKTFKYLTPGMVDGFLELTADKGTFNLVVCHRYGKVRYINHIATLLYRNRLDIEGWLWNFRLMKVYPTSESKSAEDSYTGTGSGFALSSDGYIATCNHVTEDAKHIQVTGINGDFTRFYNAQVILSDPMTDLSVIKINDPEFKTLGEVNYDLRTDVPVEGEPCYAIGYPRADLLGDNVKVTNGIISAVNAGKAGPVFCQISVPVTYGNSGGPLIDGNGNVLGIISAGYGDKAGYMANLAVKASYLKLLLESDPVLRKLTFKPILVKRSLTEIVRQVKDNVYLIKVSNSKPESSKNNIVTDKSINSIPRPELQDNGNRVSVLNEVKEKHRSGNYEDAVNILSEELQKDSLWADAYYFRALCYSALGRQNEAILDYDSVLKYHKGKSTNYSLSEIYQNKSICQAFVGAYNGALETIDKAIIADESDAKSYEVRGCIYYYLGDYGKCIDDLTRTIEKGNRITTAYYFRALAKFALKDFVGARSDMEQAASMGDEDAAQWLERYR